MQQLAKETATEAFQLHDNLAIWDLEDSAMSFGHDKDFDDEQVLTRIFFAATSIYLSGNFDYRLDLWRGYNISVPVLSKPEILQHFDTITKSVKKALTEARLSPLLFLYPLRVAGSRSQEVWQQAIVRDLLCKVRLEFVVAETFLGELEELWRQRDQLLT